MAPDHRKIDIPTLIATLLLIILAELLMGWLLKWTPLPHFARLIIVRLAQTGGMLFLVIHMAGGLHRIGWAPDTWLAGLKKGALWSAGFGVAAAVGMATIHLLGGNPLKLIHMRLPERTSDLVLLFVAGGLVAPIAEEICFRGILYTCFRRWGILCALGASTAIFVVLHLPFNALPVTQVVGGIVFAVAYETSHNLMTPITIHVLGNTALFALSLPVFHS